MYHQTQCPLAHDLSQKVQISSQAARIRTSWHKDGKYVGRDSKRDAALWPLTPCFVLPSTKEVLHPQELVSGALLSPLLTPVSILQHSQLLSTSHPQTGHLSWVLSYFQLIVINKPSSGPYDSFRPSPQYVYMQYVYIHESEILIVYIKFVNPLNGKIS